MRSDGVGSRRQININHRAASSARFTVSSAHSYILARTAAVYCFYGATEWFCSPVLCTRLPKMVRFTPTKDSNCLDGSAIAALQLLSRHTA